MDIFAKCGEFTDARLAKAAGLYPYFMPLEDTEGTEVVVDGRRILMIGSNNYLGLTTDPRVRQASIDAVTRYGTSLHRLALPQRHAQTAPGTGGRLAAFVGKPAALVFSTGYQVNLGTISSPGQPRRRRRARQGRSRLDRRRLHAGPGRTRRFNHNDLAPPRACSGAIDPKAAAWSSSTGSTSMGGDLAPLPQMIQIGRQHGARLMVDDAHSPGRDGRRPRHGRPFRRHGSGRPDHGHLQQVVRLARRFHRRRCRRRPLHPAPRPFAHLQRFDAGLQRGRRPGRGRDHGDRAASSSNACGTSPSGCAPD